jgi:hypothetical protein
MVALAEGCAPLVPGAATHVAVVQLAVAPPAFAEFGGAMKGPGAGIE